MPKKKKSPRKPQRRPQGDPRTRAADDEIFPMPLGPARTLLEARKMPGSAEIVGFMAAWPFNTALHDGANSRSRQATLLDLADQANQTVFEAAESIVALEENGLLVWDEGDNVYWMTQPA